MFQFLSSLKLAIILIAGIAIMSVLATIYPDADAFHSWSFRMLVIAFFLNLGLCTIKLLPGFFRQLRRTAADVPEQGGYVSYEVCEDDLLTWLRKKHYKISRLEEKGQVKLLAKKGRLGLAAPHLLHISLLIILVGALLSTFNVNGYVMGQVGQTRPFPDELQGIYGADGTIEILDFQTVYDDAQTIDNWVTHFNLQVNGVCVAENAETKVNAPFHYRNMLIYQNSYDYRYLLEVKGASNPEDNTTYGLPNGMPTALAGVTLAVGDVNGQAYMQIGEGAIHTHAVNPGDTLKLNDSGATVTYLDRMGYTVLELKTRRGTNVVFAGFLLATLASLCFFCGRYQELRILCEKNGQYSRICCYSKNAVVLEELQQQVEEQWTKRQEVG